MFCYSKLSLKNRMRSEASHPGPHVACVPVLPLVTAERRNDCLSLTALARRALSLRLVAVVISRSLPSNPRSQWLFLPLQARGGGGRNARATSRAVARHLDVFPPAIRSRESPAAAGSAAIIRPSQKPSRFAAPTLCHIFLHSNTKNVLHCAETVDEVTSLWKP